MPVMMPGKSRRIGRQRSGDAALFPVCCDGQDRRHVSGVRVTLAAQLQRFCDTAISPRRRLWRNL